MSSRFSGMLRQMRIGLRNVQHFTDGMVFKDHDSFESLALRLVSFAELNDLEIHHVECDRIAYEQLSYRGCIFDGILFKRYYCFEQPRFLLPHLENSEQVRILAIVQLKGQNPPSEMARAGSFQETHAVRPGLLESSTGPHSPSEEPPPISRG